VPDRTKRLRSKHSRLVFRSTEPFLLFIFFHIEDMQGVARVV
jgi:hypothetical protein